MALLESFGAVAAGRSSERAKVQKLSLLSMEKLWVEIRLSRGFGKWRMGRKTQQELWEIKGSGILMKKEKRGGVFATALPSNILFSIFYIYSTSMRLAWLRKCFRV